MSYFQIKLNTARNALLYVIKAFNIKELYTPYYICPSVRTAVKNQGCKIIFYNIDKDFRPIQDFPENAFVLYPNYFGICSNIVDALSNKYQNLIVDNAHSFFAEPKGIASFNSLRKFFPKLRDGAFLYTKKLFNCDFDCDDYSYELKILSYEELVKNENRLDYQEIKFMSKTTFEYFSTFDLDAEKGIRLKRFYDYHNKLENENLLNINLKKGDIPFSYPFLAKTPEAANKLVASFEQEIYRYWTNLPDSFQEKLFYTNLVSIPIV